MYLFTDETQGLCSNFIKRANFIGSAKQVEELFDLLLKQWPERSHNTTYVVPMFRNVKSKHLAYLAYVLIRNKWHGSEYADLRRELLAWMIEELKK